MSAIPQIDFIGRALRAQVKMSIAYCAGCPKGVKPHRADLVWIKDDGSVISVCPVSWRYSLEREIRKENLK